MPATVVLFSLIMGAVIRDGTALVLLISGFVALLVGKLGLIIEGFRMGVLWGLAVLLLPLGWLLVVVSHWEEAKQSFFIGLIGFVFVLAGAFIRAASMA